jgi:3-deoxy-D-manno-octulosonic acid (KDO) 8-phosphate synthase
VANERCKSPEDLAAAAMQVFRACTLTDGQMEKHIADVIADDRAVMRAAIVAEMRQLSAALDRRTDAVSVVARRTLSVAADRIEKGRLLDPGKLVVLSTIPDEEPHGD